ncbi:hypothetical protein GQ472_01195 [archaeon]|nr:hypothetical protein [archaeon]
MGSIFYNFNDCLDNLDSYEKTININVGLRPSGKLHIGNFATLLLSFMLSDTINSNGKDSMLRLTICDLDLPYLEEDGSPDNCIINYRDMPDEEGCHDSFSLHVSDNVEKTVRLVQGCGLNFNYEINFFSELQKELGYRVGLKKLLDKNMDVKMIYNGDRPRKSKSDKTLVYPLCPECRTSSKSSSRYDSERGVLSMECLNAMCDVDSFEFDVYDTEYDIAVHFFLNAIRDIMIEPFADVHVLGGDYASIHGGNRIRGVEKVKSLMELMGAGTPDYLVGPLLMGNNGQKMGKSIGNGLNFFELIEDQGDDIIYKMIDFTRENIINNTEYPKNDSLKINYEQIKSILKI